MTLGVERPIVLWPIPAELKPVAVRITQVERLVRTVVVHAIEGPIRVDKALQVLPGRVLLSSQNVNDSGHRITGSRLDFPIMPGQAVLVNCGNVQGTVMVYATAIAALDNIAD